MQIIYEEKGVEYTALILNKDLPENVLSAIETISNFSCGVILQNKRISEQNKPDGKNITNEDLNIEIVGFDF